MFNNFIDKADYKNLEKNFPFLRHAKKEPDDEQLENLAYSIIDIETTGLYPASSEIIEIAAIKVIDNEIKDIFNTLITPSKSISPEIEKLTGISNQMVSGYPAIEKVLPKFLSFVGGTTLIAHNTDFDVTFLKFYINKHLAQNFTNPSICTLKISRRFLPELPNHKLLTLAEYFKIPTPLLHRALADAEITYQLWLKMLEGLKKNKITTFKTLSDTLK